MSGGGSFGYSNANSRQNSGFQNGSDFRQQVNPYQQGYLNNMMSQAQSAFSKFNKNSGKNIKEANANQGAIYDIAKGGLQNLLAGGAYTSPQGQAIFQHIMGQTNPAGMQGAATPNYQQFGIGNGSPVGMNPFLTGGSREGQMPINIQPPRPGIPPEMNMQPGMGHQRLQPGQMPGMQQPGQMPQQMSPQELELRRRLFGG